MLGLFVFTLDPQNVEEDLEYINEHNLNSATFWRGVCSQYHQTFFEIRAEVDEAKILEKPLDIAKIEKKLPNLKPLQEIPHVLHIVTQPKIPKEKKHKERSANTLIEQMYQEYKQTDLAQALSHLTLPPPEMELKDISQEITKITGYYPHIEKFSMRNAHIIGTWLAAFTKFKENKANRLSRNFEDWLNVNTHFKELKAYNLRNFAKLSKTIPKILNWCANETLSGKKRSMEPLIYVPVSTL